MQNETETIIKVDTKEGMSADGRAWTLFQLETNTGRKISTFDFELGNRAKAMIGSTAPIYWNEEEKPRKDGTGNFTARTLVAIADATIPAGGTTIPAPQVPPPANPFQSTGLTDGSVWINTEPAPAATPAPDYSTPPVDRTGMSIRAGLALNVMSRRLPVGATRQEEFDAAYEYALMHEQLLQKLLTADSDVPF